MNDESKDLAEAKRIALDLYVKHRDAIDFIVEQIQTPASEQADAVRDLLTELNTFHLDTRDCVRTYSKFVPESIEGIKHLDYAEKESGWKSQRPAYFELGIENRAWRAKLVLAAVSEEQKDKHRKFREKMESEDLLKKPKSNEKPIGKRTIFWSETLLRVKELENLDSNEAAERVIDAFKKTDLYKKREQVATVIRDVFVI